MVGKMKRFGWQHNVRLQNEFFQHMKSEANEGEHVSDDSLSYDVAVLSERWLR